MVTITKNGKTHKVTLGAYNEVFKKNGWELADAKSANRNPEIRDEDLGGNFTGVDDSDANTDEFDNENDDSTADTETEDPDLSEIPVSEMSVAQLKQYAEQLGIEFETNNPKPSDLRRAIRKVLEN